MNEEPSVLDYVKSRLMPWRKSGPDISASSSPSELEALDEDRRSQAISTADTLAPSKPTAGIQTTWPWRSLSALFMAFVAQWTLEPSPNPDRWQLGLALYLFAVLLLGWAVRQGEWRISGTRPATQDDETFDFHTPTFITGAILLGLGYLLFGKPVIENRFTLLNTLLWLAGTGLVVFSLWHRVPDRGFTSWFNRALTWVRRPSWNFRVSPFAILWIIVFGIAVYFRFHQLALVPPEMNSDHAEKLLDVLDVLNGQYSIFFPRNTGREPLQFYLIALTTQIFGTGISFLSMKIGTALAGVVILPFIYLIGKEVANRQAGLIAMAFAGIAYWPNVLSRVALRFSLYPLFAAPALYFLLRGLRYGRRNDFILAGLATGIGLLGYTPFRIVPLIVVLAVGLAALHHRQPRYLRQIVLGLMLVAFIALAAALPLMRFAQDYPEAFSYRAFSRLTEIDQSLKKPAAIVFTENLVNALLMFGWDDGRIWPVSIPGRPALDVISASFFYLGIILLLVRYIQNRRWEELFLVAAVPLLMLPSILSLAFPAENPAPNRAGGAMVAVFVIIGISLDGLLNGLRRKMAANTGQQLANLTLILLFGVSAIQNYDLVFRQYQEQYALSAWNTSEMGKVLAHFAAAGGDLDSTWVITSPHWVDTRLVGIHAGDPSRDFGIGIEAIPDTVLDPRAKLVLVRHFPRVEDRAEEEAVLTVLQQTYPRGWAQLYTSDYNGKDFWMFFVPPAIPGIQSPMTEESVAP